MYHGFGAIIRAYKLGEDFKTVYILFREQASGCYLASLTHKWLLITFYSFRSSSVFSKFGVLRLIASNINPTKRFKWIALVRWGCFATQRLVLYTLDYNFSWRNRLHLARGISIFISSTLWGCGKLRQVTFPKLYRLPAGNATWEKV